MCMRRREGMRILGGTLRRVPGRTGPRAPYDGGKPS